MSDHAWSLGARCFTLTFEGSEGYPKPSHALLRDPSTWDIGSSGSVFWAAGTCASEATRVAYAVHDPAVFQPLRVTRMTAPTKATIDPCKDGHYIPLARG